MTEPIKTGGSHAVADQRAAIDVLAQIADQAPGLPPAYITVTWTGSVRVYLSTAADFERWRSVLGIAPTDVELHVYASWCWVTAANMQSGVEVEIGSDVPLAPVLAAVLPQQDAKRRARVDQLAAQQPPAAPAVMPLAERTGGAL